MSALLSVRSLGLSFGDRSVLRDVSFELVPGTVTALLGTNGAGKSTLLRCALGLLEPTAGEVQVLGLNPQQGDGSWRAGVGYVPDQPDAYPWMSARDLFRFLACQGPNWSDARALELMRRLDVPPDERLQSLSRGEAAKVMLAAALAPAPRLMLLDEPFARLAPPVREEVLSVFLEEAPVDGGAALLATHDLEVAARVADRVLLLDRGVLVADVDTQALLNSLDGSGGLPEALRRLYPEPERGEPVR